MRYRRRTEPNAILPSEAQHLVPCDRFPNDQPHQVGEPEAVFRGGNLLWGGTFAPGLILERGPTWADVYQTIEGGAGRWVSTKFPSLSPKFRLNTTPDCYSTEIASTGWTFYQDPLPEGKLGVAQLTNRIVFPPDGIPFENAASQVLLGYAWMALPLIPANTSPLGVPTGDQSWTLLLKATNFSGLVAFYTPETYSAAHLTDRTAVGRGLDARPALMGSEALEIGNLPMMTAYDSAGVRYRRIPPVRFDADDAGRTMLLQEMRYYSKGALWDGIDAWLENGLVASAFGDGEGMTPRLSYCCAWLTFRPEEDSRARIRGRLRSDRHQPAIGARTRATHVRHPEARECDE